MSGEFFRELCYAGDLSLLNPKSSPILTGSSASPRNLSSLSRSLLHYLVRQIFFTLLKSLSSFTPTSPPLLPFSSPPPSNPLSSSNSSSSPYFFSTSFFFLLPPHPPLHLLLKIIFSILGSLHLHFRIHAQNSAWTFIGISLYIYISLGNFDIFTALSLPIYEHGISLYFFRSF